MRVPTDAVPVGLRILQTTPAGKCALQDCERPLIMFVPISGQFKGFYDGGAGDAEAEFEMNKTLPTLCSEIPLPNLITASSRNRCIANDRSVVSGKKLSAFLRRWREFV
jgi:hypothetical protein